MFDNVCKFLCTLYPERYAAWILKELHAPVRVLQTELSLEPIRADSVIFLQTQDRILHLEFQVDVQSSDPPLPLRMPDYWVRLYRQYRMPVEQVLILLRESNAARSLEGRFQWEKTSHAFRIIRLWEEDPESFMQDAALFPLAVLARTQKPEELLNRVAERVEKIDNIPERNNLFACTRIVAGVRFKGELINLIFREDMMRESVIYQEILQEGLQKGKLEGIREGVQKGKQEGTLSTVSKLLQRKCGALDAELQEQLKNLSLTQIEELIDVLLDFQNPEDLKTWLSKL